MEDDEEDQEQGKKVEKEEEVVGESKGEKEATGSRKAARKEDEVRERHKNGGNGSKIFLCVSVFVLFLFTVGRGASFRLPDLRAQGREERRKGGRDRGKEEEERGKEGSRDRGKEVEK